ncbi:hypothetical protein Bca4012_012632 [Brassica carinata]
MHRLASLHKVSLPRLSPDFSSSPQGIFCLLVNMIIPSCRQLILDSPCSLSKMMFFTDVVGRPYYVSPEADVWSAGVIVLLSGVPPS